MGDTIKVATVNNERIWVEIDRIGSNRFYGTTESVILKKGLPFGSDSHVSFVPDGRIYDLYRSKKINQATHAKDTSP